MLGEEIESPNSSLERELVQTRDSKDLKIFGRPTLDSEQKALQQKHKKFQQQLKQHHQQDSQDLTKLEQINIEQKNTIEGLVYEKRTLYDDNHGSNSDENDCSEEENPH